MKKLLLLLTFYTGICANAQMIAVESCYEPTDGLYTLFSNVAGRNEYRANRSFDVAVAPEIIRWNTAANGGNGRWEIIQTVAAGLPYLVEQVVAFNLTASSPNPPETGWVGNRYICDETNVRVYIPQNVIANGGNWSSATTWNTGSLPRTYDNVTIAGEVTIDMNASVLDLIVESGRALSLGSNNLTSYSTAGKVITDGTGKLFIKNNGGIYDKTFPVSTPSGSGEIRIVLSDPGDRTIAVGVNDNFSQTPLTENRVQKAWTILGNLAGLSADITFSWYASDESEGFDRSSLAVARYNTGTGKWEVKGSGLSATGGDPYSVTVTDITAFSLWGIFDSQDALPVTLTHFTASREGNTALLNWSTTSESNSDRFEIERSNNAKSWVKVGEVASKGESENLEAYSFTDKATGPTALSTAIRYYRLKMIDKDETYAYSSLRSLDFGSIGEQFMFYPNPVTDRLLMNKSAVSKINRVQLNNLLGIEVLNVAGISEEGVSVAHLPAGIYIVRITEKDGSVGYSKIVIGK
jgi:hypothetical protein